MDRTRMPQAAELTAEERTDRLLAALRPIMLDAVKRNNVRAGAKIDDIESNSAAAGDVLARALMEASSLEFARHQPHSL